MCVHFRLVSTGLRRRSTFPLGGSTRSFRASAISPHTAARLARASGTSDRFWTDVQTGYDLELVTEAKAEELDRIVLPLSA